jgi:hypothetical protein
MSKTLTENNFGYHDKSCRTCQHLQIDNEETPCKSECTLTKFQFMISNDIFAMQARHRGVVCDAWEKQNEEWKLFKHIHIENITSLL